MAGLLDLFYGDPMQQAMQGRQGAPGGLVGAIGGMLGGGQPNQAQGAPGASQGQQSPTPNMPLPNSPPDLTRLYMQLEQRGRAEDLFNTGMANIVASKTPGFRQPAIPGRGDTAGNQVQALMNLQQYGLAQNAFAQLLQPDQNGVTPLGKMAKDLGVSEAALASGIRLDPGMLSKIIETRAGLVGDPATQEMIRDRNQWIMDNSARNPDGTPKVDANGQPVLLPGKIMPEKFKGIEEYRASVAGNIAESQARERDLVADQHNYRPAAAAYDRMINDAESLLKEKGLDNIVGAAGQYNVAGNPLNSEATSHALSIYNKIMAQQYSAGVQDFRGAGRITQQELNQDAPSQSIMKNRNMTADDFRAGVRDYINTLKQKKANLPGGPGSTPDNPYGSPPEDENAPPDAAIEHLKAHPELAPQFDAKYGDGAAKKILGQ